MKQRIFISVIPGAPARSLLHGAARCNSRNRCGRARTFHGKPVATGAAFPRRGRESEKKNFRVLVPLQRHHQAGHIETMQRLPDGAIGDLTSTRCYWNGQTTLFGCNRWEAGELDRPETQ